MSKQNMEKMKQLLEEKKAKSGYLQADKVLGSGKLEKANKNKGNGPTRTKKIAQ